jgi:hypothetical protein
MKYRKKQAIIEAEQYLEYGKLVEGMCNSNRCYGLGNTKPHVHTIHDDQIVILEVGDFIIPEPNGINFYPCKPDIFALNYEPFDPSAPTEAASGVEELEWARQNFMTNDAFNHDHSKRKDSWRRWEGGKPPMDGDFVHYTTEQIHAEYLSPHAPTALIDGWISVSDELPETNEKFGESDYVLVIEEGDNQTVAWYNKKTNEWRVSHHSATGIANPTHWQPLPTPPKQ